MTKDKANFLLEEKHINIENIVIFTRILYNVNSLNEEKVNENDYKKLSSLRKS